MGFLKKVDKALLNWVQNKPSKPHHGSYAEAERSCERAREKREAEEHKETSKVIIDASINRVAELLDSSNISKEARQNLNKELARLTLQRKELTK